MKKDIEIIVFEEDLKGAIPLKPSEFMLFWEEKIKLIPAKFKEIAEITIESNTDDEYCYDLNVKIAYTRTETDQEEAARKEKDDSRIKACEKREIETLNKLKAKYPDA